MRAVPARARRRDERRKKASVGLFAGKPATPAMLVNAAALVTACCAETPGPAVPEQRVGLGTSRHRGAAL